MNTPSNTLIKCGCCGDDVAEDEAVFDKELGVPIDQTCHYRLLKAQVALKEAKIGGCYQTKPDIELRPLRA